MSTLFDPSPAQLKQVPLHLIRPDPEQPRKQFDPEGLAELAASIKAVGILQPLLVRVGSDGLHTILAGERRWRAAGLAGLTSLPCLVLSMRMEKLVQRVVQCTENAHRHDLTPLEYMDVISEMLGAGLGAPAIADALGKRVDWVRGYETAGNPAYRALFETGRLRSVDVLAHFRALPDPARRELLDSGLPITSTRCAQLRERYRELEANDAKKGPPKLWMDSYTALAHSALPSTPSEPEPLPDELGRDSAELGHSSEAQRDETTGNLDARAEAGPDRMDHSIVPLAVPSVWIDEAGGVKSIRRIALAALANSRDMGWQDA
ncbi:MAG: ParB/RepB/Spo0J family partition protein [Thiobacillaceae bacterium]